MPARGIGGAIAPPVLMGLFVTVSDRRTTWVVTREARRSNP